MELTEFTQNCLKYYRENVKPLIEKGLPLRSYAKMAGLVEQLDSRGRELLPYHAGLQCASHGQFILKELADGRMPSTERAREFEAQLAQLGLAVSSHNVG